MGGSESGGNDRSQREAEVYHRLMEVFREMLPESFRLTGWQADLIHSYFYQGFNNPPPRPVVAPLRLFGRPVEWVDKEEDSSLA